jgi:hypothetical protein
MKSRKVQVGATRCDCDDGRRPDCGRYTPAQVAWALRTVIGEQLPFSGESWWPHPSGRLDLNRAVPMGGFARARTCKGLRASVRQDEWHLVFAQPLDHFELDLLSRLRQADGVLWLPFGHPGLEPIGAIGNSMTSDRPEYLLIERFPVAKPAVRLARDQQLESFQDLERCFETEGSRRSASLTGRLSHDRSDQVVRQHMSPDLLAHELRRLATQDVHREDVLDRPPIEFHVPASAIELSEVIPGGLLGVQQRRRDDEAPDPKAALLDPSVASSASST